MSIFKPNVTIQQMCCPPQTLSKLIWWPQIEEDRKWEPNMEDDLKWKMTQNGKMPKMEDTSSLNSILVLYRNPIQCDIFPKIYNPLACVNIILAFTMLEEEKVFAKHFPTTQAPINILLVYLHNSQYMYNIVMNNNPNAAHCMYYGSSIQ